MTEHDFFDEQPIRNADVFMARFILHLWPDQYCAKILKRLRDAAQSHTKLIIFDEIIEYLSRDKPRAYADIDGAGQPVAPSPLFPYPEVTTGITYNLDMIVRVIAILVFFDANVHNAEYHDIDDDLPQFTGTHVGPFHRVISEHRLEAREGLPYTISPSSTAHMCPHLRT